jgi:hypothetical protein
MKKEKAEKVKKPIALNKLTAATLKTVKEHEVEDV